MSFENIKSKTQAQRGFTIVELLIVVVVIAILAAITIVSFNGITSRANQSAAKATAATVQKKAELFAADSNQNRYPVSADTPAFPGTDASKSWYFTGITANYSVTALTSSSGNSTVRILKCSAAAPTTASQANIVATGATAPTTQLISGMKIIYWDPVTSGGSEQSINVGDTTSCPTAA